MALILAPSTQAAAQPEIPSPPDGCYAYDSGGSGIYQSVVGSPASFDLDVDGPVVQAIVEWAGVWTNSAPSTTIGVTVAGPGGTLGDAAVPGTQSAQDPTGLGNQPNFAFGFYSDITSLFGAGTPGDYTVTLTPPIDDRPSGENNWWGATVTVIYDTSPCDQPLRVIWKTGADFYFGGNATSSPTTETIVYSWDDPLEEDYLATFQLSHGGSQHDTTACRVSAVWVASGSGTAPTETDPLITTAGVPVAPWGAVEGIVSPFTPPLQSCAAPQLTAPVTSFAGGHVGPQWAVVQFEMLIPAGSTWAAMQLESPVDRGGPGNGAPESGAWGGTGVFLVPVPSDEPPQPDIALEKTVLAGGDTTACPGVEGTDELVVGEAGDTVTYCFRIINTGDTHLYPVTLTDPDLGIDQDDMTLVSGDPTVPLAPGGEIVYAYVTTLTTDLVNTATVTGIPSDDGGDPLPDLDPVTDDNDAEVRVLDQPAVAPGIALEKTVLEGDVPGSCPGVEGTDELVTGAVGDTVTYCFRIINTGDTHLYPVTLTDPDLGIDQDDMTLVSGDPTVPLAPGGEIVYAYVTELVEDLVNTATVTGVPSDEDGDPLPDQDPVEDDNDAEVRVVDEPAVAPGIALEKTVLEGGVPGSCPGVEGTDELVTGEIGDTVTYCFRILNTGDTYLYPITLEDADLGIDQDDMTLVSGDPTVPLAPGGEIVYAYVTELVEDLVNTATVTGVPSDEDGDPLPDQDPVEDDNDAEVRVRPTPTTTTLPPTTTTRPPLPRTGSSAGGQAVLGAVMTLLGAAIVLATRGRTTQTRGD